MTVSLGNRPFFC